MRGGRGEQRFFLALNSEVPVRNMMRRFINDKAFGTRSIRHSTANVTYVRQEGCGRVKALVLNPTTPAVGWNTHACKDYITYICDYDLQVVCVGKLKTQHAYVCA